MRGFSSFFFRKKRADPVSLSSALALLCGKRHVWVFHKLGASVKAVFLDQPRKGSPGPVVGRGARKSMTPLGPHELIFVLSLSPQS